MRSAYDAGLRLLRGIATVKESPFARQSEAGFAATDSERAAELHRAFRAEDIGAIFAGRGGYGCLRLLPLLDFELIAGHPKPLIGLSDITILQLALLKKCRLVSFSGPLVASLTKQGLKHLLPHLMEPSRGRDLIPVDHKPDVRVVRRGAAEGRLIGGNLYSLTQLIGTRFMPKLDGGILFFEDVDETANHLDSFLHHLKLASGLRQVSGVVIGDLSWRKERRYGEPKLHERLFVERLTDVFGKRIPIVSGVRYGHVKHSITIPIGVRARLDTRSRSLTLLEECTRG